MNLADLKPVEVKDIVEKYQNFETNPEEALEEKRKELAKLTKDELIEEVLKHQKTRTDTVQELARAILSDEDFLHADYKTIAQAIKELKEGANTSDKSIASYVSKKKHEWNLPPRIRITK